MCLTLILRGRDGCGVFSVVDVVRVNCGVYCKVVGESCQGLGALLFLILMVVIAKHI